MMKIFLLPSELTSSEKYLTYVRGWKFQVVAAGFIGVAIASCGVTLAYGNTTSIKAGDSSPIYGVTIPNGYRQWQLVGPALESAPLDELRATVANAKGIDAYSKGVLPFPDGTILVKLAWKHQQSPDFPPALVPATATTVQVMVKDSKRYAESGGWGYGRFVNGKAVDIAQHQTCFACHAGRVKDRDYVFTRFAP